MKQVKKIFILILALSLLLCVPAQAADSFTDVSANASYADAVNWCVDQSLMNGVGNSRFDPNGVLTRATLATVLYRAKGSPAVTGAPGFNGVVKICLVP